MSPKKHQRINDVASELISLADEIASSRPDLSALLHALGEGLVDSGYPKELFLPVELPKNVTIVQVGRKFSFRYAR